MARESYRKPDHWALRAKEEGYPARSVYKLKEIDAKFRLLRPGMHVLDLGAAPGSWSAYALERIGPEGFLAAIDLSPLARPAEAPRLRAAVPPAFLFLQGDLYDPENRAALIARGPYDLVMSDAAPSTTGNSIVDTERSAALVEAALSYAREILAPGGSFLAKLFQGGDQGRLIRLLKDDFAEARAFKPQACRSESFETYIIATGKRRES